MWKDCETELDFLDFDYLIKILENTVNDEKLLPSSIGVYGDWGSGKSSLMYMCKNLLSKQKGTVCLMFNGWLFEGYEDAKTAILGSILDGIAENRNLSDKAKLVLEGLYNSVDKFKLIKNGLKFGADIFLTGGIGTIADLTIRNIVKVASKKIPDIDIEKVSEEVKDKLNNKELRDDIKKFREEFADLLIKARIKKLVIFIDELDRCNPNTILDTLEAMRLFLFTGRVSFVIGADERHISYAVKNKFKEIEGIQMDIGKEYLEKLIQYPIRIPRLNDYEMEFYIMSLLFQSKLSEEEFQKLLTYLNKKKREQFLQFAVDYAMIDECNKSIAEKAKDDILVAKQLASILTKGLNGNPRQCKRFLNTLDMRLRMAKYKGVALDTRVLAKIMEVEYFRTSLFRKMAQLSVAGTLSAELTHLKKKEYDELNELKLWKDDLWVTEWIESEPILQSQDLCMYFYFTRTSLDNKGISKVNKMSDAAKLIFNGIRSGSDMYLRDAIKNIDEISDFDAEQILDGLFSELTKDTELDNEKLKRFLRWGSAKNELQISTVEYIRGISGNKIKLSMLPLINEFYISTKKSQECKEALEKWEKENTSIASRIDKIIEGEK
jgi:predicted KAP-like P-loop ATPase